MRKSTLIVLAAAASLGAGIFLLRRSPQRDPAPRAKSDPSLTVLPSPIPTPGPKATEPPAAPGKVPTKPQPAPSVASPPPTTVAPDSPRPGQVRGTVTL